MNKGLLFLGTCFLIGGYNAIMNQTLFIGVYGTAVATNEMSILIGIVSLIFGIVAIFGAFSRQNMK